MSEIERAKAHVAEAKRVLEELRAFDIRQAALRLCESVSPIETDARGVAYVPVPVKLLADLAIALGAKVGP